MPPRGRRPRIASGSCGAVAAAVAGSLLAGCAHTPGSVALPDPGSASCLPAGAPGAGSSGDTLTVSAPGPIGPRAGGSSPARRMARRHLRGTLVRVDCAGRVRPGLAASWDRRDGGRRWLFRLQGKEGGPGGTASGSRDPRRAGDGGGLPSAPQIVRAWQRAHVGGGRGRPSPLEGASAAATGPRTLEVTLDRPHASPGLFAGPRFAVGGAGAAGRSLAAGSHRLEAPPPEDGPGSGAFRLAPRGTDGPHLSVLPHATPGWPRGPEPRDLLDRGVDLLVTRDAATLGYARTLEAYRTAPLPWHRTYVLAVPAGDPAGPAPATGARADRGPAAPGAPPGGGEADAGLRRALARDAVPVEARAARPPHWWTAACEAPGETTGRRGAPAGDPTPAASGSGAARPVPHRGGAAPRLVYPAGDPVARSLASRLGALAGSGAAQEDGSGPVRSALAALGGGTVPVRAVGLEGEEWRAALLDGGEAGYLIPLPRRALAPCAARERVRRRIPWIGGAGTRVVPLVDTRPRLVLRRGVAGVALDWDGVPRLAGARRESAGAAP